MQSVMANSFVGATIKVVPAGNKQVTRAAIEYYGPDRAKFLGDFTNTPSYLDGCDARLERIGRPHPLPYPDLTAPCAGQNAFKRRDRSLRYDLCRFACVRLHLR